MNLDPDCLYMTRRSTSWIHHPLALGGGWFPAATVVRVLDERGALALVTDEVLQGWVHVGNLEPIPERPRTALERLMGEDDL